MPHQNAKCTGSITTTSGVWYRLMCLLHFELQPLSMRSNSSTASSRGSGLKPITQTDVRGARRVRADRRAIGDGPGRRATGDRASADLLTEVARFPPPSPGRRRRAAVAAMKARVGDRLDRSCRLPASTRTVSAAWRATRFASGATSSSGLGSPPVGEDEARNTSRSTATSSPERQAAHVRGRRRRRASARRR